MNNERDKRENGVEEIKDKFPQYTKPVLNVEGSYSKIFFGIRVGANCSSACSRVMPEM